ncbi:MGDG synthase family glycosyltransferase [Microbispora sp. NBC_01389]|uniref:MGDG synthase family glycosyltransferase n=1 Tax=Microbispora sp. NBC_01389 TaxID=2903584 RepID=UPI00324BEDA6
MTPPAAKVLIVSASMGAGHDGVAAELARRLAAMGVRVAVVDVLALLPLRLGSALRWWYRTVMLRAPWLYALVYRIFFASRRAPSGRARRISPLTVVAAAGLNRVVRRLRPSLLVPVFHVAAQAAGHLRSRGRLAVPSVVVLTDFAAHRLWLHGGNDRYLCPDAATALAVTAATGRPAFRYAPIVRPGFAAQGAPEGAPGGSVHGQLGLPDGDRIVLVGAGAWGVGRVVRTARALCRPRYGGRSGYGGRPGPGDGPERGPERGPESEPGTGRYVPVVLCGRGERLRRRLTRLFAGADATEPAGLALGWRDDLPGLLAGAYALVDNAAGLTCREAFAAGVPVVTCLPIPGHGRDGVLAMARAGVSVHVRRPAGLLRELDRLAPGSPARAALTTRAAALFTAEPAEALLLRFARPDGAAVTVSRRSPAAARAATAARCRTG